ncbi:MAG: ABC transporter ATP-binding protein [Gemmatimonadales bacterium]
MRRGTSSGAWREARALLRRQRGRLTAALILVVANRVAALALPAASKHVVDEVIGRQRTDLLAPIALVACAAVAVEAATAFGASQIIGLAAHRTITELRRGLQARVLGLPIAAFEATQSGTLVSRIMTDPEQVRHVVGNGLMQLASGLLTAMLAVGLLFYLNPSLTALVLALLLGFAIGLTRAFGWLYPVFHALSHLTAEITGQLAEVLGGIRVVKTYVAERREAYRFTLESHRLLRHSIRARTGVSALTAASTAATGIVGVVLLIVGSRAVAAGTMTLGDMAMYVFLVGLLAAPIVQIAATAQELGKAAVGLGRIAELRALATEAEEDRPRGRIASVVGTVDFEAVSYAYVPGRLVLRDVSLHAPPGSTTALVGPSGSGKSTLCRLLLAFDRPTSGRILVDGRDVATLRRCDYRAHLGVVLQEDVLFDGTIADNIRYGWPGAALSNVYAAGRRAHCDEFVQRCPDGYATLVGERGVRLSAGQRQRVAIARAILADPRILILDEATSSLDSESEVLIQDALRTLCRGRTTFVIAHRLSTIRSADQILVIEAGTIVERGNHEMLLAREGRYWRLYHTQHCAAGKLLEDKRDNVTPVTVACAMEGSGYGS